MKKCGVKIGLFLAAALFFVTGCRESVEEKQTPQKSQTAPVVKETPPPVQQEPLVFRDEDQVVQPVSSVSVEAYEPQISSSSVSVKPAKKTVVSEKKVENEVDSTEIEPKVVHCTSVPAGMACDTRDGQMYRTVKIGQQLWLAQNMNFRTEGSWCFNNRPETCESFGRLYNWTAAMDLPREYLTKPAGTLLETVHRGVCMEGWHIPSNNEMKVLERYVEERNTELDGVVESVGTSLKSENGWAECEPEDEVCSVPTDRYGFGALPAGRRNADGSFNDVRYDTGFWISAEALNGIHAPYWDLYYSSDKFWGSYSNRKKVAYSVRCIKD